MCLAGCLVAKLNGATPPGGEAEFGGVIRGFWVERSQDECSSWGGSLCLIGSGREKVDTASFLGTLDYRLLWANSDVTTTTRLTAGLCSALSDAAQRGPPPAAMIVLLCLSPIVAS